MKTRIFRSPHARYYAEDILEAPTIYSDEYLRQLRIEGFSAVWLRIRLRDAARTAVFPDLGSEAGVYRQALNVLCERAAAQNVGVYLYFNEPLCFPADHPFWLAHPDVRGASGSSGMDDWDHTYALCTSHPDVQEFLTQASADMFHHCPEIAGLFTITASEHHTNCYSHNMDGKTDCPRCAARSVADVVAEVNNLILAGVRAAGSKAKVIAWNWGWSTADAEGWRPILDRLDPEIALMADFEIGGKKVILGKERTIDEYSLSYVGPSEPFTAAYAATQSTCREVFAKLQIGTTHELATINNLPLIPNLLAKARWLRSHDVSGALLCWNFGSRLTLNTWAFNHFLDAPDLHLKDDAAALTEVACQYLGVNDAAPVLSAWSSFVRAFDHYPFAATFVYSSPVNYAPVFPLPRPEDPDRPMQPTWIPLKRPFGTRLSQTVDHEWGRSGYTIEECRGAFQKMATIFGEGVEQYRLALTGSQSDLALRELRNAEVIGRILRSTANIYAAYILARSEPFDEVAWRAIALDEVRNLAELLPQLAGETEIGYHSEAAAWFFTGAEIQQKITRPSGSSIDGQSE